MENFQLLDLEILEKMFTQNKKSLSGNNWSNLDLTSKMMQNTEMHFQKFVLRHKFLCLIFQTRHGNISAEHDQEFNDWIAPLPRQLYLLCSTQRRYQLTAKGSQSETIISQLSLLVAVPVQLQYPLAPISFPSCFLSCVLHQCLN